MLPHRKFQTLVDSVPRRLVVVLAFRDGLIRTICWCVLYFGSYLYILVGKNVPSIIVLPDLSLRAIFQIALARLTKLG